MNVAQNIDAQIARKVIMNVNVRLVNVNQFIVKNVIQKVKYACFVKIVSFKNIISEKSYSEHDEFL